MFPSPLDPNDVANKISDVAKYVRSSTSSRDLTPLPPDFTPGPHDVICARGKVGCNHPGNRRYHLVIEMHLQQYSEATSKVEKSLIMSSITDSIKESSPNAGFVKQENGRWYIVGDHAAREKVGQSLRNLLHTKYSSSTKAKKQRKEAAMKAMGSQFKHQRKAPRRTKIEESDSLSSYAHTYDKVSQEIARITAEAKEAVSNLGVSQTNINNEADLDSWFTEYEKGPKSPDKTSFIPATSSILPTSSFPPTSSFMPSASYNPPANLLNSSLTQTFQNDLAMGNSGQNVGAIGHSTTFDTPSFQGMSSSSMFPIQQWNSSSEINPNIMSNTPIFFSEGSQTNNATNIQQDDEIESIEEVIEEDRKPAAKR